MRRWGNKSCLADAVELSPISLSIRQHPTIHPSTLPKLSMLSRAASIEVLASERRLQDPRPRTRGWSTILVFYILKSHLIKLVICCLMDLDSGTPRLASSSQGRQSTSWRAQYGNTEDTMTLVLCRRGDCEHRSCSVSPQPAPCCAPNSGNLLVPALEMQVEHHGDCLTTA